MNSFIYNYDRLNRLTSGITADSAFAERNITYDQAGNIQTLSRVYGGGLIDSLAYDYNGTLGITNQLQSIADNSRSRSTAGLPSHGTYYLYDGNGNVTSNGGKNYRITSNLLNLPDTISPLKVFSNIPNPASVYYYDANGDKLALAQGTTTFGQSPVYSQYRYYINGIQYDLNTRKDSLDMTFVQNEQGRVFPYSSDTSNYYEYFLSDH